jgi:hypothetical protein
MKLKNRKTFIIPILFMALLLCLSITVMADSVEQTGIKAKKIPIKWETTQSNVQSFSIYMGTAPRAMTKVADVPATQTTYSVPAEKGGLYYIQVKCTYKGRSSSLTKTVATLSGAKTLPSAVTGLRQKCWWRMQKRCAVIWDKVPAADGYELIYRDANRTIVRKATVDGKYTSRTDILPDVQESMTYSVHVRAYTKFGGKVYYGDWSPVAYLLCSPYLLSSKIDDGKLVLTWKTVAGATGYEVYVSRSPDKDYVKVKTVKGNTVAGTTVKKFKKKAYTKDNPYYVYVVAYKKAGQVIHGSGSAYYWQVGDASVKLF